MKLRAELSILLDRLKVCDESSGRVMLPLGSRKKDPRKEGGKTRATRLKNLSFRNQQRTNLRVRKGRLVIVEADRGTKILPILVL